MSSVGGRVHLIIVFEILFTLFISFEEITSESNKLPNEPPTSPNTSQSILNLPEEKLDQVLSGGADYAPLLLHALATCHSIQCVDGELIGDPMDLKMFEFTGWVR
jgi:magnesium-transporting ATPase (P-type)